MYPLHPLTVHFPIALLLASVLLSLLYLRRGGPASLTSSAYHCMILGWFGALLATLSGLFDAWRQVYGPDTPRDLVLLNWVNAHAALGVATVVVFGLALQQRRRQPAILDDPAARTGYVRLLVLGALLLLAGAWVGGRLVYGFGLGVSR